MNLVTLDVLSIEELMAIGEDDLHEKFDNSHYAVDDVSGGSLVPHMVASARGEELEYFKFMNVYEHVPHPGLHPGHREATDRHLVD